METSIKLTLFFDGMFWVGVFEKTYKEKYEVSRTIFGSEPKDYEVYDFIIKNFNNLKFSNSVDIGETCYKKINPKKQQREIKKEMESKGAGTKAQLALKMQHELNKVQRKKVSKENNEQEKERKFKLKQQKKKLKHRGH